MVCCFSKKLNRGMERVGELFFNREKTSELFDIYRTYLVMKELYNLAIQVVF